MGERFETGRLSTDGFGNLPHEPDLTSCNCFRPAMATELYFNHPSSCNNDRETLRKLWHLSACLLSGRMGQSSEFRNRRRLHHHVFGQPVLRLAFSFLDSPSTRGEWAHSACPRVRQRVPPQRSVRSFSALCSLVKRHQLFRHTARTLPCPTRAYTCVDFSGSPADLDGRYIGLACLLQLAFTAVSGDNSMPFTRPMRKSFPHRPGRFAPWSVPWPPA